LEQQDQQGQQVLVKLDRLVEPVLLEQQDQQGRKEYKVKTVRKVLLDSWERLVRQANQELLVYLAYPARQVIWV
jgi:hypothetical protein